MASAGAWGTGSRANRNQTKPDPAELDDLRRYMNWVLLGERLMSEDLHKIAFDIIGEGIGIFGREHPAIDRQYPSTLMALVMSQDDPAEYCVLQSSPDLAPGPKRQALKLAIARVMRRDIHPVTAEVENKFNEIFDQLKQGQN
jgi:hypothetical protein